MTIEHNAALIIKSRKLLQQHQNQCGHGLDPGLRKTFYESVCSRCGKQHQVYMNWTGRGKPRIYCELCRPAVDIIKAGATDPIASGIYQAGKRQVCPQVE